MGKLYKALSAELRWAFLLILFAIIGVSGFAQTCAVYAYASRDTICDGDTTQLFAVQVGTCDTLFDDFDPVPNVTLWDSITGGTSTIACGFVSGNTLLFNGTVERSAHTKQLNVAGGGTIQFYLYIATFPIIPCDDAEPGDEVYLSYSIDSGQTWVQINMYDTDSFPALKQVTENIPLLAHTDHTIFRWNQTSFLNNTDNWAIDLVDISCNWLPTFDAYSWNHAVDLNVDTIFNPVATVNNTRTYTVTASDSVCTASASVTIVVQNTIGLNVGAGGIICEGENFQLNASSGIPSANFNWIPALDLSCTNCNSPVADPDTTRDYKVIASSGTCIDSSVVSIAVDQFTGNIITGDSALCEGDSIQLRVSSSAIPDTFSWTPTTGFSSIDSLETMLLPSGVSSYALYMSSVNNCEVFDTVNFVVDPIAVSGFGYTNNLNSFSFNNSSTSATQYYWDFGDGDTSSTVNPIHVFDTLGMYTVCLIASDSCSQDTSCNSISVSCFPVSSGFSYSGDYLEITFADTSSYTGVASWQWDFGDGTSSSLQNPIHTFSNDGTYEICLILSVGCNADTLCDSIAISCPDPQSGFTSGSTLLDVVFTNTSMVGAASFLSWDLGDGNTSTMQNPTHKYASPGDYFVCLSVTDTCGADVFCDTVHVACPQTLINFGYVSNFLALIFTDSSSISGGANYNWNFGDGNFANSQNPSHTFGAAGSYTVCLTVMDSCGTDSLCKSITVDSIIAVDPLIELGIVKVFPNPSHGILYLKLDLNDYQDLEYAVIDLNGKALLRETNGKIRKGNLEIDLAGIENGIYMLEILLGEIKSTRKIILFR